MKYILKNIKNEYSVTKEKGHILPSNFIGKWGWCYLHDNSYKFNLLLINKFKKELAKNYHYYPVEIMKTIIYE